MCDLCQGALVYRTFPLGRRQRVVFNDWRALLDAAFRRWKMESIYADMVNLVDSFTDDE